jgi:hypothetical protein
MHIWHEQIVNRRQALWLLSATKWHRSGSLLASPRDSKFSSKVVIMRRGKKSSHDRETVYRSHVRGGLLEHGAVTGVHRVEGASCQQNGNLSWALGGFVSAFAPSEKKLFSVLKRLF